MLRNEFELDPYDYEKVTVGVAAGSLDTDKLTPSNESRVAMVIGTVEGDQLRYRTDGTAPDSNDGHLLNVGDVVKLIGFNEIKKFSAIRITGNATLICTYYH